MQKEEDLLTPEEIAQILEEAKDPKYSQSNLLHLGSKKTSIFRVSSDTGLVLANGNSWTGREHIDIRHSPTSRMPFWKDGKKLENQTKFHLDLPPIWYLKIADQIYKTENLRTDKNNRPDLFDVFVGRAQLRSIPETEYTLVTYKHTKIIHSFYVSANKKPFNKKKILDLRQGWVNSTTDFKNCIDTFTIPYFNSNNTERYKIILRTDRFNAMESWFVQVNDERGTPILTTLVDAYPIDQTIIAPFRMSQIDFSDLTWIEKELKKMENGEYEFIKAPNIG